MILLASRSPQRTQLLQRDGLAHLVVSTAADDADPGRLPAKAVAVERARAKARAAAIDDFRSACAAGDAAVVAADTVVDLGGKAVGTPRDRAEAMRILASLAGTRHTVVTAHCCYRPGAPDGDLEAIGVALAQITMLPMTMEDIEAYVASGESDGRAGAYAIQESGDRFVADIEGDRDTVIGLNVATVRRLYREVTGNDPETQR